MHEGQLSLGKEADLDLYNRLSGNLRRILESLGLERCKRVVNARQTLADIADQLGGQWATEDGA